MSTYAGTEPGIMFAPTTEINPALVTSVKITWTPPADNGGISITAYRIMIRSDTNMYYTASECNGANSAIRDSATCDVPLLTLIQLPFVLKQGATVQAKIVPINLVGEGSPSAVNNVGAIVETAPVKPPVAPTKNPLTTKTSLVVDYKNLFGTANGGSVITAYQVEWDQGPDIKVWALLDESLSSQITMSTGIVAGRLYGFRYRAQNRQGWGPYSEVTYILAANVPAQIAPVETSLVSTNVKVTWIIPDNGSQPITRFNIEFLASDGKTYMTIPNGAYCTGLDVALNFCEVPMSVLTSLPFLLSQNTLI